MSFLTKRTILCLSLLGVAASVVPLWARQACSTCTPTLYSYQTLLNATYKVCIEYGFSPTERAALKEGIEGYWPNVMSATGTPMYFEVVFADDEPEFLCDPYDPDMRVNYANMGNIPTVAEANITENGVGASITVNSYYMNDYWGTGTNAQNAWYWIGAHELGHLIGFQDVGTSGCQAYTIMKGSVQFSAAGSYLCGDVAAALIKYPKRDDDEDGYSPDDTGSEFDCDDTDPNIHPNVIVTCDGGSGDDFNCNGQPDIYECQSPIVVDMSGNGFRLTNVEHGVEFDLDGDGVAQRLPWIAVGSDDAWLALDRNGNQRIDNGSELFGNFTAQPPSTHPNGFIALGVFDEVSNGGNANGLFDEGDQAFDQVVVWNDGNHDGISQTSEMRSVRRSGIKSISLQYSESQRRDEWGNWFRYRAVVRDGRNRDIGKFAWDVFLNAGKPANDGKPKVKPGRPQGR